MSSWFKDAHWNMAMHGGYFPFPRLSTAWEEWEWVFWSDFSFKPAFDKQTLEGSWNPLVLDEGASVTMWKSQKSKFKKKIFPMWYDLPGLFCSSCNWRDLYSCLEIKPGEVEKKGAVYPTVCENIVWICHRLEVTGKDGNEKLMVKMTKAKPCLSFKSV